MVSSADAAPASPPLGGRGDDPPGAAPALPRAGFAAWSLVAAWSVVVVSGLLAAAALVFDRSRELAQGQRLTDAFAVVVDEQTSRSLQALDLRLELVAQYLEQPGLATSSAPDMLEAQLRKLPFVDSLHIFDARGQLRGVVGAGTADVGTAGADLLQAYRTRPGSAFVLDAPRLADGSARWTLSASRPIRDSAGDYAGAVMATVQAEYFEAAWRSLARESGGVVSLLRTDGTLLMRSPLEPAALQRRYDNGPLVTEYLPVARSGRLQQVSPIDGSVRQAAYRTLAHHPDLVVVVARAVDVVLAQWRQRALLVGGGWLLGSLALILATLRLRRLSAQRRHAEHHMLALAQRMSIASEAAGIVSWDWDPREPSWYATPTHCTLLGYPPRDGPVTQQAWQALLHADDRRVLQAALDQVRLAGEPRYSCEIRMRHADGSYRWMHSVGRVQERDTQGRPTRIIGVHMDITERKRAEIERQQMLARITDGFVALDLAWRFVYVNPQAAALLGRDAAELLGKSIWDAFPSLPDEDFAALCRQAMAEQKPVRIEAWYPDLGLWLEDHIYPSPDGMSIYFRDITQRKSDELALRQAKEHAERLISHANVMIVGLDAHDNITLFNQAAQDLTGYTLADLAGRHWFDILCPRQRYPQVWATFESLAADGPPRQFEHPILTRSGKELIVAWQNTILRDGETMTGTLSFGIDVTARRQAERELAESRDQFETLARHSMQGIALVRKGQLSYVNPALCTFVGRSAAELTAQPLARLMQWLHPDDRANSEARQRQVMRGGSPDGWHELRIRHADGHWRWAQTAVRPITLRGEPAMLGMVVDIHDRKLAEMALRDSEERFRSTFESSAIGMSLADRSGRWIMVNPALCRIVGYSETELLQRDHASISHPDDMPLDRKLTAELFAGTRTSFQMEKRYLHRDGHVVWINLTLALVRDAAGQARHTVAHVEDIGPRKRLALDLHASQDRLRATLDALPDLMFEVDLQGRYHDYHSPRTDLLVAPPAQLLGRRVADVMPADAAATVMDGLQQAMARGHASGHQIALALPDGTHWFELSIARKASVAGEPTRFVVLSRDISDRIRTGQALRNSEELMRQMAESVSQVFWMFDMRQGRFLYISPAVEAVLGCSASELRDHPQHWRRYFHPEDLARVAPLLDAARTSGRYDLQLRLLHPDGDQRWIHARAYPIHGSDALPYRCAGVVEDITARKTLEIRELREREVLQFLASGQPMHKMLEQFVLAYESMVPGMLGSVLLLDANGATLRHGAAPHLPQAYCDAVDGTAIGPGVGSCGTAAHTGQTVIAADIATDPRWADYRELALAHGLRACWSVPIKSLQDEVLGTFAFYFRQPRDAAPDERASIERGAHLASQAIERHMAVRALQDSEERYRTLVEWSPEAIVLHQDGRISYVNPAGAALLGAQSTDQLIGLPVLDIVHPDDRTPVAGAIRTLLRERKPTRLAERRIVRLDGSVIDVETKASPIVVDGVPAVLVVMRDVTTRKRAEADLRDSRQQLRVLSAKVLAAQETERRRIAHELHDELGQALTAIKINLQAEQQLGARSGDAPMAENIRIVEQALQQVRGLALALRPSMLDDLGLAPALRWLTEQITQRGGVQVQLHAAADPGRLSPDLETAVFRIVQEALTNIVRHAQARHAQVDIAVPAPGRLRVSVRDDGIGCDVAAVRRHASEGNSIGVLGMQERAMLVGGELALRSEPGEGCAVVLQCPLALAPVA